MIDPVDDPDADHRRLHSRRMEQRLSEEVHLNLAYRWFCRLDLDGAVTEDSITKHRQGGSGQRHFAQAVRDAVDRCMTEGLVGAEGFAVDASLIRADSAKLQRFERLKANGRELRRPYDRKRHGGAKANTSITAIRIARQRTESMMAGSLNGCWRKDLSPARPADPAETPPKAKGLWQIRRFCAAPDAFVKATNQLIEPGDAPLLKLQKWARSGEVVQG